MRLLAYAGDITAGPVDVVCIPHVVPIERDIGPLIAQNAIQVDAHGRVRGAVSRVVREVDTDLVPYTLLRDLHCRVRAIADLGIRHLHLSGGTRLPVKGEPISGYDRYLVDLVVAIRDAADVEIEINVGPSLTRGGVRALKELGVAAVTSSLEVLNAELFAAFKPGDSLEGRIRLMELCEEEGLPIRSMMLVGLGETDADRIDHLLFLRRFSMLRHLRLSRYMPFPGTASGGVRCSPWPVARLTAIARLLYPTLDLGLAAGNAPDDMALWWLAGGGNQVIGATASMKDPRGKTGGEARAIPVGERVVVHDNMARVTRYLGELGLTPSFAPQSS